MGGPSDWLGTCKGCMRRLFVESLSETVDSVGLLVFDNRIVVDVPLAPWTPGHQALLERELGKRSF